MLTNLTIIFMVLITFQSEELHIPTEELIGKGTPDLYGNGYKLRNEAHEAFLSMQQKAREEGIEIKVVSSYRSFAHQKSIWNRKYNTYTSEGLSPEKAIEKIIEYTTIPGTSRHHWGTDIDIVDANVTQPKGDILLEEHFNKGGVYSSLKQWMETNASEFGFCLVYTKDEDRKGFKYEPWHYTFEVLSKPFLEQFCELDLYEILSKNQLEGSSYLTPEFLSIYAENHILGIQSDLKY